MYYEYIYDKLLTLLNVIYDSETALKKRTDWFTSLQKIAIKMNLSPYETQVLYSYHFFNINEIQAKVPQVVQTLTNLYNSTSWNIKLTYLNIINYTEFIEYCRTNKSYFTYLYYEFLKKVNNTKIWNIVQTVNTYNIPLTVVEDFYYAPKINQILTKYSFFTYKLYEIDLLTSLDSQYEATISKLLDKNYKLDKPKGVRGRSSNNDLVKAKLGWDFETSLKSGLEITYKWIEKEIAKKLNNNKFSIKY
jgi:hypothetical protein